MQTLMQAVDEQCLKYDVNSLSNRQRDDLHLVNTLATIIFVHKKRVEQRKVA